MPGFVGDEVVAGTEDGLLGVDGELDGFGGGEFAIDVEGDFFAVVGGGAVVPAVVGNGDAAVEGGVEELAERELAGDHTNAG